MLFKKIFTFLLLAIGFLGNSQTLKFEQFTTKDGLLSDEVYNLHQDTKGYLWLFTNYGAMKYNGKTFEPVLKNLPFSESIIYSQYENKYGQMWISNSNKKIYEIRNDSAFIVKGTEIKSDELKKNAQEIYQLYVDDSLNIYAKTFSKSVKFSKLNKYAGIDLNSNTNLFSENVYVFKDQFFGVQTTKNEYNRKTENYSINFIDQENLEKKMVINCEGRDLVRYYKSFDKDIYFSFFDKIIKINPDHSTTTINLTEQILNFTKDDNNHLWVACYRGGLIEIDEHDKIINTYFPGKTVNDVLIDSENGLWISTNGSGIYHCSNLNELHFNEEHVLGKPIIFMKTIDDKLFFGTTDFNLQMMIKNNLEQVDKKNNSFHDLPTDIIKLGKDFFIFYYLHNEQLSGAKFTAKNLPIFNPNYRASQIVTRGNDSIILFGRNSMIICNSSISTLTTGITTAQIKLMYRVFFSKMRKNDILIATDKGVYCFDNNNKLYQPDYLNEIENIVVTNIEVDPINNYWFCTKGNGLFKLTPDNKLMHYTTKDGLPSNFISSLSFHTNLCLLSCNKGLYYNETSERVFNQNWYSLYKGEVDDAIFFEDNIYAGTKNGLVVLNSNLLISKTYLKYKLSSVLINGKTISNVDLKKLSYKENNIEFKFDILSFSEKEIFLKYKLNGQFQDSGIINSGKLNFKMLPPGKYTLMVVAMIKNKKFESQVFVTYFNIIPAYWQTSWFIIISIVFGILILYLFIWLVIKSYKNKELKRVEAQQIIAEYRLIALKAQINPHFMSNCIAAIQHLILKNKLDEANEYLAKFSFLVRQVLNFSSKTLISLQEELEMINVYVDLEKLRFKQINFVYQIDPSINAESTLVPPLLFQPIIENAIWHGLIPLQNKRTPILTLKIILQKEIIKITIEDNGVGRKKISETIGNLRESKGMEITKQRIETINHFYKKDIAFINYDDLIDDKNNSLGTRVTITLPYNLYI